jgi:integral membrane protein (TIGR01906 family)
MTPSNKSSQRLTIPVLRTYLTITFPYLLILIAVRLVMTPLFLQVEYSRPGFPADYYGFTVEERLSYAPYALQYLLNDEDIGFLGNLRFPDGAEMYNVRELQHMRDVKVVTRIAFFITLIVGAVAILVAVTLNRLDPKSFRQALFRGSIMTLSLIAIVVIVAILSWDTFFTTFHRLFFEGGSWQFAYSDTLIRLFPEQFWFDAALTIGGLTVLVALVTLRLTAR